MRARRPLRSRRSARPPAASLPSYADPDGPARRYTDSYFCRGFDGLSDGALTLVRVLTWCAIVLATLVILGVLVWRFLNEMHTVERRLLIAECKRRKYNFHNQGLKVHLEFTPDVEAVICREIHLGKHSKSSVRSRLDEEEAERAPDDEWLAKDPGLHPPSHSFAIGKKAVQGAPSFKVTRVMRDIRGDIRRLSLTQKKFFKLQKCFFKI